MLNQIKAKLSIKSIMQALGLTVYQSVKLWFTTMFYVDFIPWQKVL